MNATEQKRPRWVVVALLAILLVPITAQAQTWEPPKGELLAAIPDYKSVAAGDFDAIGNLWTHPKTGDVYCFMNRGYGVFVSADGGDSWRKVDSPVFGRSYGCWGTNVDPMTSNMALFVTTVAKDVAKGLHVPQKCGIRHATDAERNHTR